MGQTAEARFQPPGTPALLPGDKTDLSADANRSLLVASPAGVIALDASIQSLIGAIGALQTSLENIAALERAQLAKLTNYVAMSMGELPPDQEGVGSGLGS